MVQPLLEALVEADDHGAGAAEAGIEHGALGVVVVLHLVLTGAVPEAEGVVEDFRAAAGDPSGAGGLEARGAFGVAQPTPLRHEHELGDRHFVEGEGFAVTLVEAAEERAVVVHPEVGVEAAVEPDELAADGGHGVDPLHQLLEAEDVGALLAGELVERAVVAARHAHVRVVEDGHDHVGGAVGRVEARAGVAGELLEEGVVGLFPEGAGILPVEALPAEHPVGGTLNGGHHGVPLTRAHGGLRPARYHCRGWKRLPIPASCRRGAARIPRRCSGRRSPGPGAA